MTEQPLRSRKPIAIGCFIAITAAVLFLGFVYVSIMFAAFGSKVPRSLGKHLPKGTVVLEEVIDQTGMDSFFLVKASYSSEDDITEICNEYLLEQDKDNDPQRSFAGLYSETHEVPWFPLANTTRIYAFTTQNMDGSHKEEVPNLG